MSLRDEIDRQIRFEISDDPTAQAALLEGGSTRATSADAIRTVNAYCKALHIALLNLADEVDALRGS